MFSNINSIDKIKHDIRNINGLTNSQMEIIFNLPDKDKNEILTLYNQIFISWGELIKEDLYSSNLTLHTRK